MSEHNGHQGSKSPKRIIAADIPIDTQNYPVEALLKAFRKLAGTRDDVQLLLTGQRFKHEIYSVYNELDRHGLTDRAQFIPYYERCERFPIRKPDADVWISRNTPGSVIDEQYLSRRLDEGDTGRPKYALFFTSFHPGKQEGNSTLMRRWLDHLKAAGYIVHVVYYMYDIGAVSADMRRASLYEYDLYKEVAVESRLTGANYNGLNLHVDDWCGIEAMDAVSELCSKFEYDIAITNYPWMSAVFDCIHSYTRKILLTHDSFVDRNKRMLEQGYPESGWVSIDQAGEQLACERSDVVVAMQEHEADGFRKLVAPERVQVIGPIFDRVEIELPKPSKGKLRIGYFGSSNWVNEQNLGEYLKHWDLDVTLRNNTEIIIGGGVCETLKDFVPAALLKRINPTMVGRVPTPGDFFAKCDIIINPERGGTGIKIKTLEAMAHGCGIITTSGGSIGLDSPSEYHSAADFESLAHLTRDFVNTPQRIAELREMCSKVYDEYVLTQRTRMNELLGEPDHVHDDDSDSSSVDIVPVAEIPAAQNRQLRIPEYVQENAADYHFEEFERFRERVDIRGKRVLEIGSDYHLAIAQLFMANGADSVVATNMGDWKTNEPMPEGLSYEACDAGDLDLPEQSFDIIYGIALIEHVTDIEALCLSIKKFLKPDGIVYLQGCPMWASSIGHHIWYSHDVDNFAEIFTAGGGKKSKPIQYGFNGNNPIPNWAHLVMEPSELRDLLVNEKSVPQDHADGIINYVYGIDGSMSGLSSNFLRASEVLEVMNRHFDLDYERIWEECESNEYFDQAKEQFTEEDLRTLGLQVWMTHKNASHKVNTKATPEPKVSVVIPFYGVEAFIEECIKSVLVQDYQNLEIIFVDDQSPDNARSIVERYAEREPRITLITHEQNQGLGPARNTGVNHATGEYLFFLDSDDYFASPTAVSTLVREARSSGCSVVIGSCDRIMSDGQRLNFDRDFDESHNGTPGKIISADTAYLGASFIPGGQYVPMRAWGTLIDRFTYLDSQLEYPPAEHEDLPHTPFLYHFAGKVLYIADIVITYRDRSDSISNTGWNSGKIRRQGLIWRCIKENIERFGLHEHMGNTAVKTAEHLVMKLRQNGIRRGAETAVIETLEEILSDAKSPLNHDLLFYTLDSLRGILDFQKYDYDLYRRITSGIPFTDMVAYYRQRTSSPPTIMPQIPVSDEPDVDPREQVQVETKIANRITEHTKFATPVQNDRNVNALLETYRTNRPQSLESFPAMLTEGDIALYFNAGRNFQFRGSIVDTGSYLGGTTMSLVEGLNQNPRLPAQLGRIKNLIRVYDLFQIQSDYIYSHLQDCYPSRDFRDQSSFLQIFEENMADHSELLDVRVGDVLDTGYTDAEDIEILGVDLCESLRVTDHVVRTFFPRLIDDALVIQQDFVLQYHPYIQIAMMLLDDCFEVEHEIRWGGSVSFRLKKPITTDLISERFGISGEDWYYQTDRNVELLRTLVERMHYDENKWVILQTLGVYLAGMDRLNEAHAVYQESKARFPNFELPAEVEQLIGSEAVHA